MPAELGAARLDECRAGWAREINAEKLNMLLGDVCVLGQLFGCYFTGAYKLKLHGLAERVRHGFTPMLTDDPSGRTLTAAWRKQIELRNT